MQPSVAIIDPISSGRRYGMEAKALGYRPIAILTRRSLPETLAKFAGLEGFDEAYYVTSLKAAAAYLSKKNVVALLAGHHFALHVVDELASLLHLPFNPIALREARINKLDMKEQLRKSGVFATPAYPVTHSTLSDLPGTGLRFPLILKPAEGSGSLKVKVCHTVDDLAQGLDMIDTIDRAYLGHDGVSLVEEFIPGPEYFVTTANLGKGKRELLCFAKYDKLQIGDSPSVYRNIFSQPLDSDAARMAFQYVCEINEALGVEFGINDVELKITDGKCKIIEQNNRLPGANVPHLIERATGINCYKLNIEIFSGKPPAAMGPVSYDRHFCICCLINPEGGDVAAVENIDVLDRIPAVVGIDLLAAPGEYAPPTVDFTTAFAFVYLVDEDPEKLREYADYIHANVKLKMKEKGPAIREHA